MHQLPECDGNANSDGSAEQSTKDEGLHHEAQDKKDHIATFTSLLHIRCLQALSIPSAATLCL